MFQRLFCEIFGSAVPCVPLYQEGVGWIKGQESGNRGTGERLPMAAIT